MWHVRREQDQTVMPNLVKNYQVYCNDGKDWKKLTEVRDNHQRVNRLHFKKVETDKIRIEFYSTNGCPDIRLYEARLY